MNVSTEIYERRSLLSVESAISLMITFGTFVTTLIFGILAAVKNDKKSNRS